MQTPFDWFTMASFCALVVLFLHRSVATEDAGDSTWQYLPPAAGCAISDYLGNHGWHVAAALVLLGVAVYFFFYLKPFKDFL